ncbi:hypothetical protein HPB52_001563 [Rhipicephalus sanguineus]|uniref:Secreted protein n=1 Tax=Rhipicephalus sanguineus TaxID=34632 RepID=A0A9D4PGF5_RHISA|nr:hypothetical protein HPB52_001563 [Rhipicephalus sanguineus]
MQASTALVFYLVCGLIVSMPDACERTLRLVSAPFVCAGHLSKHAMRTLVAMKLWLAPRTLALIICKDSFRPIKLFMALVAILVLSKSDSGASGLAIAFASLVWAFCPAIMVLASIARIRSCCDATSDDPQLESHESAAPEADARIEPNDVVPRMQANAATVPEVQIPDAVPSYVDRPAGSCSLEDRAMDNVMKSSSSPVQAVQVDLTGLFFDFDVTNDGRLVVLLEGPLVQYGRGLPTYLVVLCSDDGTPLDVTLVAADDEVLQVNPTAYLYVPQRDVRGLALEPLALLLQSYGMRLAQDGYLPRADASARDSDVQLLRQGLPASTLEHFLFPSRPLLPALRSLAEFLEETGIAAYQGYQMVRASNRQIGLRGSPNIAQCENLK